VFTIDLKIDKESEFKMEIVDLLGKRVSHIKSQKLTAGSHPIKWDISKMNSGIYFIAVQIGTESYVKKMVIQ